MAVTPERIGKYAILRQIGAGGMGMVYLAEDPADGRKVALKILPETLSRRGSFLQRFLRECESLRNLNHPGVPRLLDDGVADGLRYLAMEHLEGSSVEELMKTDPDRFTNDCVAGLLRDLAEILAHAHGQGILHRDISPKNIILTADASVHLIDFGISKLADEINLTLTGTHFGTPDYMAPEHFERGGTKGVDASADLWSLGAVAFRLIARRLPFESDNQLALIRQALDPRVSAPPLSEVAPTAPPYLAMVVDRLLQKNIANRYPSAQDVITALDRPEEPPPESFSPDRAYSLDDLVYLPYARRWAVVDEIGGLKKYRKSRYVGLVHQGGVRSRRISDLSGAPPDELAAERAAGQSCAECGSPDAAMFCPVCGLIPEREYASCRPEVTRSAAARGGLFSRRMWPAAAVACACVVTGLVYFFSLPEKADLRVADNADSPEIARSRKGLGLTEYVKYKDATVDVNSAKFADLVKMEYMNDRRALFLLAFRLNHGPFKDTHHVSRVIGWTGWNANQIAPNLHVVSADAAAPDPEFLRRYVRTNINSAGKAALAATPYSSDEIAENILAFRKAGGVFRGLEDVKKMAGAGSDAGMKGQRFPWLEFVSLGDPKLDEGYRREVDRFYWEKLERRAAATQAREASSSPRQESYAEILSANRMGDDLYRQRQYPEAAEAYRKAADLGEKQGNHIGMAISYSGLGRTLTEMRRYAEAEKALQRAAEISEKQGNVIGQAVAYTGLGRVLLEMRRYAEAEKAYRKGAAANEKQNNAIGLTLSYSGLGRALAEMRRHAEAEKIYKKVAAITEKQRDEFGQSVAYAGLIRVLTDQGRDKEAREYVKRLSGISQKHLSFTDHLGSTAAKYPELLKPSPKASAGPKADEGY